MSSNLPPGPWFYRRHREGTDPYRGDEYRRAVQDAWYIGGPKHDSDFLADVFARNDLHQGEAIVATMTKAPAFIMTLDAIANDAEKWLVANDACSEPMNAVALMHSFADTARKALRGETTPATPPAPELLLAMRKMIVMARHAPLVGHLYDQGDIDEAESLIAKAEEA